MDFSVTYSFPPYHSPGADSAPSENEYQEHFLGVKAAGAWGWPHHLHVMNVMKIWEPKPPGTLWATSGLLQDCFFFTHVKCPLFLPDFNETPIFFINFFWGGETQISWKSVWWEPSCSMCMERHTGRHDEANSNFSQFCKHA